MFKGVPNRLFCKVEKVDFCTPAVRQREIFLRMFSLFFPLMYGDIPKCPCQKAVFT